MIAITLTKSTFIITWHVSGVLLVIALSYIFKINFLRSKSILFDIIVNAHDKVNHSCPSNWKDTFLLMCVCLLCISFGKRKRSYFYSALQPVIEKHPALYLGMAAMFFYSIQNGACRWTLVRRSTCESIVVDHGDEVEERGPFGPRKSIATGDVAGSKLCCCGAAQIVHTMCERIDRVISQCRLRLRPERIDPTTINKR